MTTLEHARRLCEEAESRIDFEKAREELTAALELVAKDASLLDLVKRQLEVRVASALELVAERSGSATHLSAALRAVDVDRLPDPEATFLKDWFLRVVRAGKSLGDEELDRGGRLTARLLNNPEKNRRDLQLELDRLEWFAAHGPDPRLTGLNAEAVRLQTEFLPLPAESLSSMRERALRIRDVANANIATPEENAARSAFFCRARVEEAEAAHRAQGARISQTETWCIRVSCFGLERMLADGLDLGEDSEAFAEAVTVVRALIDTVGYRSSTTVFSGFKREIEDLHEVAEHSTDFSPLFRRAVALQSRIKDAKTGKDGETLLRNPHWQTAMSMCKAIFDLLTARQQNGELLRRTFDEAADDLARIERLGDAASLAQVESVAWKLSDKGALARWVERVENEGVKRRFGTKLTELRARQALLRAAVLLAEPKQVARLVDTCQDLQRAVAASDALPTVYTEIRQLNRYIGTLSAEGQASMRPHMRALFDVFDERVGHVDLLQEKVRALQAKIQRGHKRLSAAIEFDELYEAVHECRDWTRLKAFPDDKRGAFSRDIKIATIELHKLKARKARWDNQREQRASDIVADLESDLKEVLAEARAHPGSAATWEALVDLSNRLRSARQEISEVQYASIGAPLDAAFSEIKQSRHAFALESERIFSDYNDTLSDVLHLLESSPGRETAIEAIGVIKPIRQGLRSEARLLRRHRQEVIGLLDLVSRSIDEILESANANSARERALVSGAIDALESSIERADNWRALFALIGEHKSVSAKLRAAPLSIGDRRELRGRMEQVWDTIQEKLEQSRFSHASREDTETKLKRLEQQGWLFVVREPPRAA